MTFPTIHLNGTSREVLFDSYMTAIDSLRSAIAAHDDAAPNSRDYYPQGSSAFTKASKEHASREARLRAVLEELVLIAEAVREAP